MAANTKFQVLLPSKPFQSIEKGAATNKKKQPLYINNNTGNSKHSSGTGVAQGVPPNALKTNSVAPLGANLTNGKEVSLACLGLASANATSLAPVVNLVTADNIDRTTDVVCAAFKDDPLFAYVLQPVGGVEARSDLHRLFQLVYVAASVKHGAAVSTRV